MGVLIEVAFIFTAYVIGLLALMGLTQLIVNAILGGKK